MEEYKSSLIVALSRPFVIIVMLVITVPVVVIFLIPDTTLLFCNRRGFLEEIGPNLDITKIKLRPRDFLAKTK